MKNNATTLVSKSIKSLIRLSQTARVISGTGLAWLLGRRPPTPTLLRETFERLGTTYIKLGQFIASSPSLFPPEYVQEFQNCLDNTPPTPFEKLVPSIAEGLNRPIQSVFSYIDPKPLASASIAQVHRATLVTGEAVVIKIQKPGVKLILETDLNFLVISAKILEKIAPHLNMASLSGILEEIQAGMLQECDFGQEAQNLEDFCAFLKDNRIQDVVAPKVYWNASNEKILTMEHLIGTAFTDLEIVKRCCPDPQISLIAAMNTWFLTLLQGHAFHADVHAGNLMILENGQVAFIDFGIVGRIEPGIWAHVSAFVNATAKADYYAMAEAMVGIGATKANINTQAFAQDIQSIYEKMNAQVQTQDLNQNLMQIVSVAKTHGLCFPRAFALLLKQVLYFDRYVQLLAPDVGFYEDDRLNFLSRFDAQRALP